MTPLGQVLLEYLKGGTIRLEITRITLCLISAMVGGSLIIIGFIIRKGERKK